MFYHPFVFVKLPVCFFKATPCHWGHGGITRHERKGVGCLGRGELMMGWESAMADVVVQVELYYLVWWWTNLRTQWQCSNKFMPNFQSWWNPWSRKKQPIIKWPILGFPPHPWDMTSHRLKENADLRISQARNPPEFVASSHLDTQQVAEISLVINGIRFVWINL